MKKETLYHFLIRKSNNLSICIFLDKLLFSGIPVSTSKRLENSPASVKSKIQFITLAKMRFPGHPALTARQLNVPQKV